MSKTTISEIQDYITQHQKVETDEEISDKSKYRVTRQVAEGVAKNKPLPTGRCNLCSRQDDRLIPVTMHVCLGCANKFMKRGGQLKVIKKEVSDYNCDNCLTRTFTHLYVNPVVCKWCSAKIGRAHQQHEGGDKRGSPANFNK